MIVVDTSVWVSVLRRAKDPNADALRSLSQGRAAAAMEPFEYRPAPDEVMHRLLHPEDYF